MARSPTKLALLLFPLLFPLRSLHAKTLTVAVIDTGIDRALPHLCKEGHRSFTGDDDDPLVDDHGHGTHIAGLIVANAGDGDYCLVSLRYYKRSNTGTQNLHNMVKALEYAININVDLINISGGGPKPNAAERTLVKKALARGITIVTAAGNDDQDLGLDCYYYPACYDERIIVVGNLQAVVDLSDEDEVARSIMEEGGLQFEPAKSSNYGSRVSRWEVGTDVLSTLPGGKMGRMSGTSQACAVATGKLVKQRLGR